MKMMTPELWERLKPLFDKAIEMPPQERALYIERACGEDHELKLELELLVNAHDRQGSSTESLLIDVRSVFANITRFSNGDLILNRFKIVRLLGSGGMGEVYEALDLELGRIALKTIRHDLAANSQMMSRFKREVQLARQVSDPHICRIHELFSLPDAATGRATTFLTMEFLEGATLSDWLAQNGPVAYPEAESIALQLCTALESIHNAGIIHRDLKTRNIMVTNRDDAMRVVVMDFGLALPGLKPESINVSGTAQPNAILGTPAYMAPEQFEGGKVSPATDIYALGVVLYELVTGKCPFAAPTPVAAAVRRGRRPEPVSSIQPAIPSRWDKVIDRCIEYDPEKRFQRASEVADSLRANSIESVGEARPGSKHPSRLNKGMLALPLLIIVVAVVAGTIWWKGHIEHSGLHDPRERPVLLVGHFENRTGDAIFDDTLPEMFSAALQQSRHVAVFPRSRVDDTLQSMGRLSSDQVNEKVGLEICQRAGLQGILLGSISRIGTGYTLVVRAENRESENIVSLTKTVQSANQVPAAVDSIAADLRRKLGESQASLQDTTLPLARVTSPSLDAIRYYTVGKQSFYNGDLHDAAQMLTKALELDPTFAMAHATLAITYEQLTEFDRERAEIGMAASLANKVSEPERLKILGLYYDINMDYEKGCGYYKLLGEIQPSDPAPFIDLGVCEENNFNYSAALAATEKGVQMLPKSRVRINLASELFLLGETEQALHVAERLSEEYPTDLYAQSVMGSIYAASGRIEQARRTFSNMIRLGGDAETVGHSGLADLDLATGRYLEAKEQLTAAVLSADQTGNRFSQAETRIALAEALIDSSQVSDALKVLRQTSLPGGFGTLSLLLGRAYVWGHELHQARRNLQALDDLVNQTNVPPLRSMRLQLIAEIALGQKNYSMAIDAAEEAYAAYHSSFALETLARVYDAAGKKQEAAAQYRILLNRANERSLSFDAPALHRVVYAHYRLGVLSQELGNYDEAHKQLETFLTFWSHPDANQEIAKDAQRRLLVLEGRLTPTPAT